MSVSTLLGTPAAQGLFHRAIVQSGPPYTSTAEKAWARTEQVAAHLGVPVTRAALETGAGRASWCAAAARDRGGGGGQRRSGAADDAGGRRRDCCPSPPRRRCAFGSASGVPLLIGTTRDESAFFTVGEPDAQLPGRRRAAAVDGAPDHRMTEAADQLIASVRAARSGAGRVGEPPGPVGGHRHRVRVPAADRSGSPTPTPAPRSPGSGPTSICSRGSRRHSGGSSARATPWTSRSCSGRSTTRRCRRFRVEATTPSPCPRPYAGHGPRSPAPVPRGMALVGRPGRSRPRCSGPGPEPGTGAPGRPPAARGARGHGGARRRPFGHLSPVGRLNRRAAGPAPKVLPRASPVGRVLATGRRADATQTGT